MARALCIASEGCAFQGCVLSWRICLPAPVPGSPSRVTSCSTACCAGMRRGRAPRVCSGGGEGAGQCAQRAQRRRACGCTLGRPGRASFSERPRLLGTAGSPPSCCPPWPRSWPSKSSTSRWRPTSSSPCACSTACYSLSSSTCAGVPAPRATAARPRGARAKRHARAPAASCPAAAASRPTHAHARAPALRRTRCTRTPSRAATSASWVRAAWGRAPQPPPARSHTRARLGPRAYPPARPTRSAPRAAAASLRRGRARGRRHVPPRGGGRRRAAVHRVPRRARALPGHGHRCG